MVIYLSNIAGVESPGKVSLWSGTPVSRSLSSRTMLKHHIVCAQYRNQKNEDKMQRRLALQALVASLALLEGTSGVGVPPWPALAEDWRTLSEDEWKARLTKEQFGVLRKAGTELPLSSPLNKVCLVVGVPTASTWQVVFDLVHSMILLKNSSFTQIFSYFYATTLFLIRRSTVKGPITVLDVDPNSFIALPNTTVEQDGHPFPLLSKVLWMRFQIIPLPSSLGQK